MFGPGVTAATAHNAANATTDVIARTSQRLENFHVDHETATSSGLDSAAPSA
jgi:hypothetical protein